MILFKRNTIKILLLVFLNFFNFNVSKANFFDKLIQAISEVESKNNPYAVNGKHVGVLQISPICVTECNRINKMKGINKRYTLQDRYDKKKSIEMFHIIQNFYNKKSDLHYAILLWNEGCTAMTKPKRTTNYYNKVIKVYNSL